MTDYTETDANQFADTWKRQGKPLAKDPLRDLYRKYVPDPENEAIEWSVYDGDRHEFYFADYSWAIIYINERIAVVGGGEE